MFIAAVELNHGVRSRTCVRTYTHTHTSTHTHTHTHTCTSERELFDQCQRTSDCIRHALSLTQVRKDAARRNTVENILVSFGVDISIHLRERILASARLFLASARLFLASVQLGCSCECPHQHDKCAMCAMYLCTSAAHHTNSHTLCARVVTATSRNRWHPTCATLTTSERRSVGPEGSSGFLTTKMDVSWDR